MTIWATCVERSRIIVQIFFVPGESDQAIYFFENVPTNPKIENLDYAKLTYKALNKGDNLYKIKARL